MRKNKEEKKNEYFIKNIKEENDCRAGTKELANPTRVLLSQNWKTQKTSLCRNQTVKETTKKHRSSSNYSSICVTHWTAYSKLSTLTWAKMAAFCPAVTLIACWLAVAGDDAAWPAEPELPCFPEPCAGWPTRNVPWENRTRMTKVQL